MQKISGFAYNIPSTTNAFGAAERPGSVLCIGIWRNILLDHPSQQELNSIRQFSQNCSCFWYCFVAILKFILLAVSGGAWFAG